MNEKPSLSECIAKCGEEFDNYYDCLIDCMELQEYDDLQQLPHKGLEDRYCFKKCYEQCNCIDCECVHECLQECLA